MFVMVLFLLPLAAFGERVPSAWGSLEETEGPWEGSAGRGADVLFLFLAFDNVNPDTIYACGDLYWNPVFEVAGTGWSLNSIAPSWAEPAGYPYHWHGGLGSALDVLGYDWEWFPGYTGRSGQVIPDVGVLDDYSCLFVMTFDAYRDANVLSAATRSKLDSYIVGGGHVVLISQDADYSGVPESWLDFWFDCGSITGDVSAGTNPLPASGVSGTFLQGWAGTAQIGRFSSGAGGHEEGKWWADDLSDNGVIEGGSWDFASASSTYRNLFSTFDFEACSPAQVQAVTESIMEWILDTPLERSTWGRIKAGYQP